MAHSTALEQGGVMLKQRIVTAAIGIVAIVAVLSLGTELTWRLVVWVCTLLCMAEFSTMFGFMWSTPLAVGGYVVTSMIEWWPYWHTPIILELMIAITLIWPVITKHRVTLMQSAPILLGALYIGYGGESLDELRSLPHGWAWIWLCLISNFLSDAVAFFVGGFLKGPKLWPSISPKKTISGAIGGLVGAVMGAVVFGCLAMPALHVYAYASVGAIISVTGQFGDLVESAYKRTTGVKDSGKLLPGHGGMLDRIDSLLFAAPFALYFIVTGTDTWFQ